MESNREQQHDRRRDNTGTNPVDFGVPVYTVGNTSVATSNGDLWDGLIENPIEYMENGELIPM